MQQNYVVTTRPEMDGLHFVHSAKCQVLPDQGLEDLGSHEDCEDAFTLAAQRYDRLNACALCCPACYRKG